MQNDIDRLIQKRTALQEKLSRLQTCNAELSRSISLNNKLYDSRFLTEFNVCGVLGIGTFGCVFKATSKLDLSKYAVKRLSVNRTHLKTKMDEVRAVVKLDHPGIIRCNTFWIEQPPEGWQNDADIKILESIQPRSRQKHDLSLTYNTDNTFIYIQIQLCRESLANWLNENRTNESRQIDRMKAWFIQIVRAVEYIHENNIIHRNLKPSNVLFTESDKLKVCDIGITREGTGNEKIQEFDTILYMSPEQICSKAADVFSLGLIFTELCEVMSNNMRFEVFHNYRHGRVNSSVNPAVNVFVELLANVIASKRPSCGDILKNPNFINLNFEFSNKTEQQFYSKFAEEFDVSDFSGNGAFGCFFYVANKLAKYKSGVKRIAVDSRDAIKAFDEVRVMAEFDHPNIVRYKNMWIERPPEGWQIDADENMLEKINSDKLLLPYEPNTAFVYLEMELCKYSLAHWLNINSSSESRNQTQMKKWFKQIAKGLNYIHSRNLVHQNLKPSNIFLDEYDRLKIGDLGIVIERQMQDGLEATPRKHLFEKTMYMSPEQIFSDSQLDAKSDIFALGLILADLCVVLSNAEKEKIFDNCRSGKDIEIFGNDDETAKFVRKLTYVDTGMRPTCSQILDDGYLAERD